MSDRSKWSNNDSQRNTTDTSGSRSSRNDLGRPQADAQEKPEGTEEHSTTVNRNDAGKPTIEADKTSERESKRNPETEKGFANQKLLDKHYEKHKNEFNPPFEKKEDYENAAKNFMNGPRDSQTLEKIDSRGDRIRYKQGTEEYGVARPDGTIRSYYIADPKHENNGYKTNLEFYNSR